MSLSDEARRIVEEARLAYGPSEEDRTRVAASLSVQLTATAAASAGITGTATAAAPATLLAGKAAVGLAVLIAIGGAAAGFWWSRSERRPPAASAVRPASPAESPTRIAEPSVPAPLSPAGERGTQPPARLNRSRSAPAVRAPAVKPPMPEPGPNVAGEIALLDEAQRALISGNPERALQLLDQHARAFPRGTLIEERTAARVIALCALGRATAARAESAAYLRRFPSSPLAERVRAACGTGLAPTPPDGQK